MSADEGVQPVVVVGAGLSGVACARELAAAGLPVRLLDRGRRPGGRMASRRLWDRPVDLGASYVTASDPDFAAVVDGWHRRGVAREWTDTFCAFDEGGVVAKPGPLRWGTPAGLRSLVEDLATDLDVERYDAAGLDDLPGPAVVLAMPDPQARRLVPGDHPAAALLDRAYVPVLALAATWPRRTWDAVSPTGRFDGAFVNGDPVLAWIADDGRRRGDDAPVLVAHSTPDFARRHLEDPEAAGPEMVRALRSLMSGPAMSLPAPDDVHVHRWTFARPAGERAATHALVDGPGGLVGLCGDGWGPASKVETAWLSGRDLGRALVARL